ncbi:MAG: hypothetical protein AB7U35_11200 [Sphingobium sp.]
MSGRFFLLLALLLAGCAAPGDGKGGFPSLAKRPIESPAAAETSEPPPIHGGEGATPELRTRIAALEEQARRGGSRFDALYGELADQVRHSSNAAVSSEPWVAAHVALGRLEQARYDAVYALADLDSLYIDCMKDAAEGAALEGVAEVLAARESVLAMVDVQNGRIDALRSVLREP